MNVIDIVISEVAGKKAVDLVILGDPVAQNGWKMRILPAFTSSRPILYDPNGHQKNKLRDIIQKELQQLGESIPIFKNTSLHMNVSFHIRGNASKKDVDNMAKFLLDILEKAIYDNDKWIFDLHLKKTSDLSAKTTISITQAE